jgi:hypothetical protein
MNADILAYNDLQAPAVMLVYDKLASIIDFELKEAESKIWHGHPVWFIDGNPIVGYSKQKAGIRLMFWSGASFDELALNILGEKFKDASVFYQDVADINEEVNWKDLSSMKENAAHNEKVAKLTFSSVYPHYVSKVERKGRTKEELHRVITWLTSFDNEQIQTLIDEKASFETFFLKASLNPNAHLIKGLICGFRIEEIENELTKKVRYLDKLIDELAKGKKMEKILRTE